MNYIKDYDQFLNENFGDLVNKVKNFFINVWENVKGYISHVRDEKTGEMYGVITPRNAANAIRDAHPAGITIDSDYFNNFEVTPGYMEILDENGIEQKNLETFMGWSRPMDKSYVQMDALSESFEHGDNALNEEAITLKSNGMVNIGPDEFSKEIRFMLNFYDKHPDDENLAPIVIWGAPGIGKSSIPKAVIKAFNTAASSTGTGTGGFKSLIKADLSQMDKESFSVPMVQRQTLQQFLEAHPGWQKKRIKHEGKENESWVVVDTNGIEYNLEANDMKQIQVGITDTVKSWLPLYRVTNTERDKMLNDLANGCSKVKKIDKYGNPIEWEEAGGGGILLVDEFLRADPDLLKIFLTLITDRQYQNYRLGSKWGIVIASNRPRDDHQVMQQFKNGNSSALFNRCFHMNFVPEFENWADWARTKGHFDETMIEFIKGDGDERNAVYPRWYHLDPEEIDDQDNENFSYPTPRSWSYAIYKLWGMADVAGCDIIDLDKNDIIRVVGSAVGKQLGQNFYEYYSQNAKASMPKFEDFCSGKLTAKSIENLDRTAIAERWKNQLTTVTSMTLKQFNTVVNSFVTLFGDTPSVIRQFIPIVDYLSAFAYERMWAVINKYANHKLMDQDGEHFNHDEYVESNMPNSDTDFNRFMLDENYRNKYFDVDAIIATKEYGFYAEATNKMVEAFPILNNDKSAID